MSTTKSKRGVALDLRQASFSSLNLTTENHGKDQKVPRVDVSMQFLVQDVDMPEILDCKGNALETLWHSDGTPTFRELKGSIALTTKVEGVVELGLTDEHVALFPKAMLKAVKVTPLMKYQAEVTCQVRVDPTDHLPLLEDLLVAGKGVMAFVGDENVNDDKPENQEKLDV